MTNDIHAIVRREAEVAARLRRGELSPSEEADALRDLVARQRGCLSAEDMGSLASSGWRRCFAFRARRHLRGCPVCRAEFTAVRELWVELEPPRPLAYSWIVAAAAVALVAGLALFLGTRLPAPNDRQPKVAKATPSTAQSPGRAPQPAATKDSPDPSGLPAPISLAAIPFAPRVKLAARGDVAPAAAGQSPHPGIEGPALPGAVRPRPVALVVGINEFAPASGLQRLAGAVNDAKSMAALLAEAGYTVFELTPGGPADREPTRSNILRTLELLPSAAQGADFLLYWSGHGLTDEGEAFLMPADATTDARLSGLSLDNIARTIERTKLKFRQLVVIADVCKVGAIEPVSNVVANLNRHSSDWVIITSASQAEPAYERTAALDPRSLIAEARVPHGLFTYHLLCARYQLPDNLGQYQAPADLNRDGLVSIEEGFNYAEAQTRRSFQEFRRRDSSTVLVQTPQLLSSPSRSFAATPLFRAQPLERKTAAAGAALPLLVVPPPTDAAGRFFVYADHARGTTLPFRPYGWMWGATDARSVVAPQVVPQMIQLEVDSPLAPYGGRGTCIRWQVSWSGQVAARSWDVEWAAVGFFSGRDDPPWFAQGADNRGHYYNLESPRRFRTLKFQARSPVRGAQMLAKVGVLARDESNHPLALGDSLAWPITSRWLALESHWSEYAVELDPFELRPHACEAMLNAAGICEACGNSTLVPKRNNLARICSLAFIVERRGATGQRDPNAPVEIFLDHIRFE